MTIDGSHDFKDATWGDALRVQVRVIFALVRRETRAHFGHSRLGYLWAVIEPMLHLVVYMFMFKYLLFRHVPIGRSMPLFLLTGMVPYFLYSKIATYVAAAIVGNRQLLNLPQVKIFDVVVSRAILEASTYLLVASFLFACVWFSGVPQAIPQNPLALATAIAVIVSLGFGIGVINSVIQAYFTNWPMFFSRFSGPLWLVSGIWFIPGEVPSPWRDYLLYNPLMHVITWFRSGFYTPYSGMYLDKNYAIWWSATTVILGLTLQRAARRKLLEPT